MCQKTLISGFTSGFIIAIPFKYGVSLDPIYYYTLILTTFSNSTTSFQRNSNPFIDLSSFIIPLFISVLFVIGIVISIMGIIDVYQELQDEPQNELVYGSYGLGFIFGFMIVIGS